MSARSARKRTTMRAASGCAASTYRTKRSPACAGRAACTSARKTPPGSPAPSRRGIPRWPHGVSAPPGWRSLAGGVGGAEGADAWLGALGDMPFVRPSSIAAVRAALEGGATLAAPFFRARRGHPVGIAEKYAQDLLSLVGDEGAKALLSR